MSAVPAPIREMSIVAPMEGQCAGVLLLCPLAEDRVRLNEMLRKHDLKLHEAVTWRQGAELVARFRPHVVICEAVLPDADWKQVVNRTSRQKDAPRVIVISSQADDFLWAEVLNLGGYDVLPKPLVQDEVVRVVRLAWQNWRNERERSGRQAEPALGEENSK
jgi:DNA-binding response OmpR family regulator